MLYIGFEGEFGPAVAAGLAGAAIGQIPDNGPVFFLAFHLAQHSLDLLQHIGVCRGFLHHGIDLFLGLLPGCIGGMPLFFQRYKICFFLALQFRCQLAYLMGKGCFLLLMAEDSVFQLRHVLFGQLGKLVVPFVFKAVRLQQGTEMRLFLRFPADEAGHAFFALAHRFAVFFGKQLQVGQPFAADVCLLPQGRRLGFAIRSLLLQPGFCFIFADLHGLQAFRSSRQGSIGGELLIAGFFQLFIGQLLCLFRLFHVFPGHGIGSAGGRGRMVGSTADGAGLPLFQLSSQQLGLTAVIAFLGSGISGIGSTAVFVQRVQLLLQLCLLLLQLFLLFQLGCSLHQQPGFQHHFFRLWQALFRLLQGTLGIGQGFFRFLQGLFRFFQGRLLFGFFFADIEQHHFPGQHFPGFAGMSQEGGFFIHGGLAVHQKGQRVPGLFQLFMACIDGLGLFQRGNKLLMGSVGIVLLLLCLLELLLFKSEQPFQHFLQQGRIFGVFLIEGDHFFFGKSGFWIDLFSGKAQAQVHLLLLLVAGAVHFLQFFLHGFIKAGVEQLLEKALAFVGGGIEDFQKIPLGDHHRLGELILAEPQQLLHPLIHFHQPVEHFPCFQVGEGGRSGLGGGAFAGQLGADVFGVAQNAPGVLAVAEGELHKGFRFGQGIVGAEGLAFAPLLPAGCFTVEGKADGIEQGSFAGTGIPGDQEKPGFAEYTKVDFRFAGIGAEGGHDQLNGFHGAPPPIPGSPFPAPCGVPQRAADRYFADGKNRRTAPAPFCFPFFPWPAR